MKLPNSWNTVLKNACIYSLLWRILNVDSNRQIQMCLHITSGLNVLSLSVPALLTRFNVGSKTAENFNLKQSEQS